MGDVKSAYWIRQSAAAATSGLDPVTVQKCFKANNEPASSIKVSTRQWPNDQ